MLQGLFRFILYSFIIYIIYLLYKFFKALNKTRTPQNPSKRISGMMVKDEYCNTYLPKEDAIREVIEGKEYFFCSNDCRQKYLKSKKTP